MGKVAATEVMRKKKKGRPSLLDLQKRALEQEKQQRQTLISEKPNFNSSIRRSTRRNPNPNGSSPASDWIDAGGSGSGGEDDDDDDERKEKKVKLVVRLPPSSDQHFNLSRSSANSLSLNSASLGHESSADGDNREASNKKQKINAGGGRSGNLHAADQDKKVPKATDTLHGSSLESGPTTPLPDKKLLVFILDRLQKKDTYGVFSEPVDQNELPDYHEIIEHPMDFGTVRMKLDDGHYLNLEEFEADVFLICSNAMQYNAPDTIYFRQARSIQELAKRDFENLRQVNDDGEPQPKIVRRGRPPTKNLKKEFTSPPPARVGPESSSDATPATGGENATSSNNYNLRKGPMSYKFRPNDVFLRASHLSGSNETFGDWSSEWNSEFPASVLKAEAKHTKKQFLLDENRRATYNLSHTSAFGHEPSLLTSLSGDMSRLIGVGVNVEHGYTRSLARFAANLGPLAWKFASKKIESALPPGVKFGPGWVGQSEVSSQQPSFLSEQKSSNSSAYDGHPSLAVTNSGMNSVFTSRSPLPCKENTLEAASRRNLHGELTGPSPGLGGINYGLLQLQKKPPVHHDTNGYNAALVGDLSSQTGMIRLAMQTGQSGPEETSVPSQMPGGVSRSNNIPTAGMGVNHTITELPNSAGSFRSQHSVNILRTGTEVASDGVQSWQGSSSMEHRQYSLQVVPPDLNARFQGPGSPNSGLHIGSPKQPDLALQL